MPAYHTFNLPGEYRRLLTLDASGFAWEWVRRDHRFRSLWEAAGAHVRRFAQRVAVSARRPTGLVRIGRHPLAAELASWGLSFSPPPEVPAYQSPLIGWLPSLRVDTLTLVRAATWSRNTRSFRFDPASWSGQCFDLAAPEGSHLLLRRHGVREVAMWLPHNKAPRAGDAFGCYMHLDTQLAARLRAGRMLHDVLDARRAPRSARWTSAHRQAVMLFLYDRIQAGASLRDLAPVLMDPMPNDWRSSSQRSDLRRLVDLGKDMVEGGYRTLLSPTFPKARAADELSFDPDPHAAAVAPA